MTRRLWTPDELFRAWRERMDAVPPSDEGLDESTDRGAGPAVVAPDEGTPNDHDAPGRAGGGELMRWPASSRPERRLEILEDRVDRLVPGRDSDKARLDDWLMAAIGRKTDELTDAELDALVELTWPPCRHEITAELVRGVVESVSTQRSAAP